MAVSQVKFTGSPRIWLKTLKEAQGYSTSKSQHNQLLLEIVVIPHCSLSRWATCSYLPLTVRTQEEVDEIQPVLRVISLTWLQILWQAANLAAGHEPHPPPPCSWRLRHRAGNRPREHRLARVGCPSVGCHQAPAITAKRRLGNQGHFLEGTL